MRKIISALLFIFIVCNHSISFSADVLTVAGDVAVARPVGFFSALIGGALFVLTLPGTAVSGKVRESANDLFITPLRFTFCRPLGDVFYDPDSGCFRRAAPEEVKPPEESQPAVKEEEPAVKEETPAEK
ncbi:MAG: hypothetical protein HY758_06730 [Nitrospirae bacterium]|nr:hypothetical protein [Nitrospirota bacterium]